MGVICCVLSEAVSGLRAYYVAPLARRFAVKVEVGSRRCLALAFLAMQQFGRHVYARHVGRRVRRALLAIHADMRLQPEVFHWSRGCAAVSVDPEVSLLDEHLLQIILAQTFARFSGQR